MNHNIADELAMDVALRRLDGFDRDGFDLWWEEPSFFPVECAYLLSKGILVRDPETNLLAWRESLKEWEDGLMNEDD